MRRTEASPSSSAVLERRPRAPPSRAPPRTGRARQGPVPTPCSTSPGDRSRRTRSRQVFWVYAGYVCATNLAFGLLSALAPAALLNGSFLAGAVAGFIASWWGARLVTQLVYFEPAATAEGRRLHLVEAALLCLFAALTAVYGAAFLENVS